MSDDNVRIVRDAKGNPEFALLPWSDYERLRAGGDETAMLIAAGNAARDDEAFPEDVAKRLVAGEAPLKVIREWRGMTQEKLAEKSGVNTQYISQIERGARGAGKKTAAKLAPVLGVSIGILID